ncbi:MAG: response regulator [Steroidobacteraceae bacterium]
MVEDDILLRLAAVDAIERTGLPVYEANGADEAIRMLEQHANIRIVFTDINMPGSMDGIRLAHCVRDRWPPVKFIVTSGLVKVREGELPEGSLFIGKPYSPDTVLKRIKQLAA